MSELTERALELTEVSRKVRLAEEALKSLLDRKNKLERDILPELFFNEGAKSVTMEDGTKITLSTAATGSLPKEDEKRNKAIEWLVENGYGDFIECVVVASYNRGDRQQAEQLFETINADDKAKSSLLETMNHMTLASQMKQRVQQGLETPLDLLGVQVFPRARITSGNSRGE
jgi:hypothetical protein